MVENKRPEVGSAFSEALIGPASGRRIAEQTREDMAVILPMLQKYPNLAVELLRAAFSVKGQNGVRDDVRAALLDILEENPGLKSGFIIRNIPSGQDNPTGKTGFSGPIEGPVSGRRISDKITEDMAIILPMLQENPNLAVELLRAALGVEGQNGGVRADVRGALLDILDQKPGLKSGLIIRNVPVTQDTPRMNI